MTLVFGLKPKMGARCVHRFLSGSVWRMQQKPNVTILYLDILEYIGQV